jgi:DNA-binding LacI/PurR family transcriptional regulator
VPTAKNHVTLAVIAERLGVSRATVSNAYNRPDQLSDDLRKRILKTAERLGYHGPDPMARSLRSGRAGAIGLVTDESLTYSLEDPAALRFLRGVAQECQGRGLALILVPPRTASGEGPDAIETALADGFILHCDNTTDRTRARIEARGGPLVFVDGPSGGFDEVGIDDHGGARMAAEHLLGLGHRRLAVVSLPMGPDEADDIRGLVPRGRQDRARYQVVRSRLRGYRAAAEAAGLAWRDVPVMSGGREPSPFASGGHALELLLQRARPPTGILAMSDELARGVLAAAAAAGLDVPGNLSVVGFDNVPGTGPATPALTTIDQPHELKGRTAVQLLLEPSPTRRRRLLPIELIVRQSTGPPPA